MKWHQHVVSKCTRNRSYSVDGYHVLTDGTEEYYFCYERFVAGRNLNKELIPFIYDAGKKFYIGVGGSVAGALGEQYPFAYERPLLHPERPPDSRPINYVHGFFAAKKGVQFPSLTELLKIQAEYLQHTLERANSGESKIIVPDVCFSSAVASESDWDTWAFEFAKGLHKGEGALFDITGQLTEIVSAKVNPPKLCKSNQQKSGDSSGLFSAIWGLFKINKDVEIKRSPTAKPIEFKRDECD